METLTYSGTLTVLTCWCGMRHAVPSELREAQLRAHDRGEQQSIYCPLGHRHIPKGETRVRKLERELANEKYRAQVARDDAEFQRKERRAAERRVIAQKGVTTRLKNRVHNGVCPCCQRHFTNLERHMKGQHPEFVAAEVAT